VPGPQGAGRTRSSVGDGFMNQRDEKKLEVLEVIVKGLYWASLCGGILLLLSIPWLFLNDLSYALHNSFIPLDRPTYNALMFLILAELKLFIFVFLLFPAIGLHIALVRYRSANQKQR
jgi:hypothetical protein